MNCPRCNVPLVEILYGRPSAEGRARIDRGELYLGGCMERPEDPTHACVNCHYRVLDPDSEIYKLRKHLMAMIAERRK